MKKAYVIKTNNKQQTPHQSKHGTGLRLAEVASATQAGQATNNNDEFVLPEETEEFLQPEVIPAEKPILNGEFINKTTLKIDTISGKLAGPLTPPELIEEKNFQEIHSILHYVEKDDPRGEPPVEPSLDSQYKNWEEGIKIWLSLPDNEIVKNLELEIPPAEYDNLHIEENLPRIKLLAPPPQSIFNQGSAIQTEFLVESPLGIEKMEYFVNDNLIDSKFFPANEKERKIENTLFLPQNIKNGDYILKIKVTDTAKNKTEKEIPITIK